MNYTIAKDLDIIARANAGAIIAEAHKNGQSINIEAVMIHEFAEIIILECIKVISRNSDPFAQNSYIKVLKEHFGIE